MLLPHAALKPCTQWAQWILTISEKPSSYTETLHNQAPSSLSLFRPLSPSLDSALSPLSLSYSSNFPITLQICQLFPLLRTRFPPTICMVPTLFSSETWSKSSSTRFSLATVVVWIMAPYRCSHPNPWNSEYVELCSKGALQVWLIYES